MTAHLISTATSGFGVAETDDIDAFWASPPLEDSGQPIVCTLLDPFLRNEIERYGYEFPQVMEQRSSAIGSLCWFHED